MQKAPRGGGGGDWVEKTGGKNIVENLRVQLHRPTLEGIQIGSIPGHRSSWNHFPMGRNMPEELQENPVALCNQDEAGKLSRSPQGNVDVPERNSKQNKTKHKNIITHTNPVTSGCGRGWKNEPSQHAKHHIHQRQQSELLALISGAGRPTNFHPLPLFLSAHHQKQRSCVCVLVTPWVERGRRVSGVKYSFLTKGWKKAGTFSQPKTSRQGGRGSER